jgi:hypothetical protein
MSNPWKTYRVQFSEHNVYTIDIKVRTADDALDKAKDLYALGTVPFSLVLDEGGTDDWDAVEVAP